MTGYLSLQNHWLSDERNIQSEAKIFEKEKSKH